MLSQLCIFASLVCLVSPQATYFCNSPGISNIRDTDFYIITRRQGDSTYSKNAKCEFNATNYPNSHFFVEIFNSSFTKAILSIKSNKELLRNDRSVDPASSSILTRDGSLHVSFSSDNSLIPLREFGVEMRVRAVPNQSCPPGWSLIAGTCFGTSFISGALLTFSGAQSACNNMRSNLLQIPTGYSGGIRSLIGQLPTSLTTGKRWIGLTDISRQFSYYWLNGNYFNESLNISCGHSASRCFQSERCIAVSLGDIRMTSCDAKLKFLCCMPLSGTDLFFPVPSGFNSLNMTPVPSSEGNNSWTTIAIICVVVFCFCCCCSFCVSLCYRAKTKTAPEPTPGASGMSPPPYSPPHQNVHLILMGIRQKVAAMGN